MADADLDPFDQARREGFVRSNGPAARGQWKTWCKLHDQPYLEVRDRSLYATVNLDMITCENHVLTREGARRIRLVLFTYAEPLNVSGERDVRGGTGEPRLGMSIWCERIPREHAWLTANLIAKIVKQEMVPWNGDGTFAEFVPLREG